MVTKIEPLSPEYVKQDFEDFVQKELKEVLMQTSIEKGDVMIRYGWACFNKGSSIGGIK